MGRTCSTHVRDERLEKHRNFLLENLKRRDNMEDLGVDARIILNGS
jgi:hypothetical protein